MAKNLGLHDKPETTPERAEFYAKIEPLSLAPLWDRLSDIVTREPHVRAQPHIWKYDEVRPLLMSTADLITAEEAQGCRPAPGPAPPPVPPGFARPAGVSRGARFGRPAPGPAGQ